MTDRPTLDRLRVEDTLARVDELARLLAIHPAATDTPLKLLFSFGIATIEVASAELADHPDSVWTHLVGLEMVDYALDHGVVQ